MFSIYFLLFFTAQKKIGNIGNISFSLLSVVARKHLQVHTTGCRILSEDENAKKARSLACLFYVYSLFKKIKKITSFFRKFCLSLIAYACYVVFPFLFIFLNFLYFFVCLFFLFYRLLGFLCSRHVHA